jgi:hypothetical protein
MESEEQSENATKEVTLSVTPQQADIIQVLTKAIQSGFFYAIGYSHGQIQLQGCLNKESRKWAESYVKLELTDSNWIQGESWAEADVSIRITLTFN